MQRHCVKAFTRIDPHDRVMELYRLIGTGRDLSGMPLISQALDDAVFDAVWPIKNTVRGNTYNDANRPI